MARLPTPGSDDGTWGDILNSYLAVSLASDGTLSPAIVGTAQLQNNAVTNAQLDASTQTVIASVASKYTKPGTGIPATDLDSASQTNLAKASTAIQIGGDLGGTSMLPTISKLQGTTLNGSSPTNGQVLTYSSTANAWLPGTSSSTTVNDATTSSKGIIQLAGDLSGTASSPTVNTINGHVPVTQSTTLGGDLSGTLPSPTVAKLNGISLTGTPSVNQVLTASGSTAASWSTPTGTDATKLAIANNLSDVANPSTALSNLGGAPLASPAFTGTPTLTSSPLLSQTNAADMFVALPAAGTTAGYTPTVQSDGSIAYAGSTGSSSGISPLLMLNFASFQQNDGDDNAYTRCETARTSYTSTYGRTPAIYFPRGSYTFSTMKTMYNGMTWLGEGGIDMFAEHVQINNSTTDILGWGSASSIKAVHIEGMSFIGQSTHYPTASYTTSLFDQTAYPSKNIQYGFINGCSFQYMTSLKVYLGGGGMRNNNFAHFNDTPLRLTTYDSKIDGINYIGVDTGTTVAGSFATPALSQSASGGSLSNGTIYVGTTALTSNGESSMTPGSSITLNGGGSSQSVSLTTLSGGSMPTGTTGWNVYASTSGSAGTYYRVNGSTSVSPGATYIITIAPTSGTVPSAWVFPATTPMVIIENSEQINIENIFPTITTGGPGLLLSNVKAGDVSTFKADGYNTANTTQYGINGAGIHILNSTGIKLVAAHLHCVMGTGQDPAALLIESSSHISIVAPSFDYMPTGSGTIGFKGICTDISLSNAIYNTVDGVGIRHDATGASVTNFRWDELGTPGVAGNPLYTSPTVWSSGSTYTYAGSSGNNPSVTRNGSWFGLVATNTANDPSTDNGTHWVLLAQSGIGANNTFSGLIGDGSDGVVALDGSNTYSFMAKSGSTYTLSRDVNLTTLTVNSGVILKTNNFVVMAMSSIINNGSIDNSGGNGGSAGTAGTQSGSGSRYINGGSGGAGGTGAGSAGSNGGTSGSSAAGGAIGAGGAGGASGSIPGGGPTAFRVPQVALVGTAAYGGSTRYAGGGAGAGGGGGDGTNSGGGGGGGGGMIALLSPIITNNATITANGGNGGTPTIGNCGGGGGGGGGFIVIFSGPSGYSGSGTITANNGTGGNGVGTGSNASSGTVGTIYNETLH
jgi:hypothetical protein